MCKETRIFDILNVYTEKWPEQKVALARKENGEWRKYSPAEYQELTRKVSYALIELGIQPKDKVAIISGNRPEWNILDMAIMQIGAIDVPIYPTISKEDYRYILDNCDAKMVVLEGVAVMNKVEEVRVDIPKLEYLYTFQNREKYPYFAQLVELGEQHPHEEELKQRMDAVRPEHCATIVYTSGTTGEPKGAMLSHSNIMHQIYGIQHTPSPWSKTAFSFLPICHAYERLLVYMYQYLGMSVYYAESLATIGSDMKEVHPTMMTAVPRLLEKMYEKIVQGGEKQKGIKKRIFKWALHLAEQYRIEDDKRSWWYNFRLKIADKLVYSTIRANLGAENFDIVVSGAASISQKIASFFSAIKMPVYEGYGMTETSPVIAVSNNSPHGREVGSVGQALPGVEIKIAPNGELCCRGHNVMMGYYKNPELTKEIIDTEGWLHTGDLGHINEYGQVFITGRLKSLFKTSMGKYVNPQIIEDKFTESDFFENVVVFGEGQKYAAAIIVPSFAYLKEWCQSQHLNYTTPEEVINMKEVKDRIAQEVQKYNKLFGETEQIKRYTLIADEWSTANRILTPTLKVKRKVVEEKYRSVIQSMFS
ncbi:MAG: long-chain fatty acid--CoA ligase [Bacteroidales bacterium]|nr:long-chain fatty acid--CoA ligase [Bacteroidales bacterium]